MRNGFSARTWVAAGVTALLTGVPASGGRADDLCPVGQFRGEYSSKREGLVFAKCDTKIDFDWGRGGPKAGDKADGAANLAVGVDDFSAEWTGRFRFNGGKYTFIVVADDGVRLSVDGELLINEWQSQRATEFRATKNLAPGEHEVHVNYFEGSDEAMIKVQWVRSGP